jgi:hypothetical protein
MLDVSQGVHRHVQQKKRRIADCMSVCFTHDERTTRHNNNWNRQIHGTERAQHDYDRIEMKGVKRAVKPIFSGGPVISTRNCIVSTKQTLLLAWTRIRKSMLFCVLHHPINAETHNISPGG